MTYLLSYVVIHAARDKLEKESTQFQLAYGACNDTFMCSFVIKPNPLNENTKVSDVKCEVTLNIPSPWGIDFCQIV